MASAGTSTGTASAVNCAPDAVTAKPGVSQDEPGRWITTSIIWNGTTSPRRNQPQVTSPLSKKNGEGNDNDR
jgi:hypothetical protein